MAKPTLEDAVAAFDDDALLKTMLDQLVRTFPSFADGPARVKEARDRLIRLVFAAPDMLAALKLAQLWLANSVPVFTHKGPMPLPAIAAAIAKAEEPTHG